jgi:hypothetical protein
MNINHRITSDSSTESTLKQLRLLMPSRVLSLGEALQITERQANRLLDLHHVVGPAVPIELITEQPRIRIEQSDELPASGSAHWDGSDWVITVNSLEYDLRQRYTLCHEFKHIIDHPIRHRPIRLPRGSDLTQAEAAERVADFFAACVLMPKAWVKTAFLQPGHPESSPTGREVQRLTTSDELPLEQLGLTGRAERCVTRTRPQLRRCGGLHVRHVVTTESSRTV